jgi:hypothetical protein
MNVKKSWWVLGLVTALWTYGASAVPVKIVMPNLRCIQNYQVPAKEDDSAYMIVTGVAKGADVNKHIPESGTLVSNAKKPPITEKEPATLWEGDLGDGEFAYITVTLYQGKGEDAAKKFQQQLEAAEKAVAERSKKTITADEAKKLAADTLKAEQGVVTKVHDTLSREKNTDHYGGLFNILVRNEGGKIVKRLDPVGLTFGEHFGTDLKIYTKIKWTRNNVMSADKDGEFYNEQLKPISDDKQIVRVKMLETESVKVEGRTVPLRNVTDYLADIQVVAGGKPQEWKLGGENVGPTDVHMYWDFAE